MEYRICTVLRGIYFVFYTSSGLFSPKRIDPGTRLLIDYMELRPEDKLLDLGCGYGPIGIVASKFVREVHLVDIDRTALRYARINARMNACSNVLIYRSDLFSAVKDKFSNIVTNPPISAGKQLMQRLIKESWEHLVPGGLFQLVLRRGQKSYLELLKQTFGSVEVVKKKAGYWIIKAEKQQS